MPFRKVIVGLGLVSIVVSVQAGSAQVVDHARINELFALLEKGDGIQTVPLVPQAVVEPPAVAPSTYVNGAIPNGFADDIPEVPFDPKIPVGENCPGNMVNFEAKLSEVIKIADNYEEQIIALSKREQTLYAASLEFIMSGESSCSERARADHAEFLTDIAELAIPGDIFPAEELQVCAQLVVTDLNAQIDSIDSNASRALQNKRLALSNTMTAVAGFDGRATNTVERLVNLEQLRQKLAISVQEAEAQCAAYDDIDFSTGYD